MHDTSNLSGVDIDLEHISPSIEIAIPHAFAQSSSYVLGKNTSLVNKFSTHSVVPRLSNSTTMNFPSTLFSAFMCPMCTPMTPQKSSNCSLFSRRPLPSAPRFTRISYAASTTPVLALMPTASASDDDPQIAASSPAKSSSTNPAHWPSKAGSTSRRRAQHQPPIPVASEDNSLSTPTAPSLPDSETPLPQRSNLPHITSLSLKLNGTNEPLPSVTSLMRYMNDLRPKLDYLDPRARERVLSALEVANVAHSGQLRKSGEPFIIHPVAVAAILAEMRMDRDCIIAGLLHDTVEDTPVTLEDLETLFGTDVRRIVEGETKLSKLAKKVRSGHDEQTHDHDLPKVDPDDVPCDVGLGIPSPPSTITGSDASNVEALHTSNEEVPAWQRERQKREDELQKQADNLRAMFIAMTEDVRVIIVKLADRLHNMRTLGHMSPIKQKKISKETLEFFAPLAHRLGMRRIKSELEELSFMYLHPEEYHNLKYEVKTMLARSKFDHYLKSAEETIKDVLQQDRILYNMIRSVEVTSTTKELYSIYRRMQAGESVLSMLDVATMRVVVDLDAGVDSNQACYHVLGRIHTLWKPLPKRLKDYIAFPKPNGYQSLHTTVMLGQKFEFLTMEIQIRTAEMDRIAEEGIAAELFNMGSVGRIYELSSEEDMNDGVDVEWRRRTTGWLISIREYIKEFSSSKDLVDAVRKDLLGNRVFVFTPKGSIVDLPQDSTPIDVAYRIHSDVGNSMIGAKVNGRMVSLDYKLQNADVVNIVGSKFSKGPSPQWISYAKSRTARQKIRQFLRARDRDNLLDRGRRLLEEEARMMAEPVPQEESLSNILPRLCAILSAADSPTKIGSVDDLYVAIAREEESSDDVRLARLERTVLRLLRDRRHRTISAAVERRARHGSIERDSDAVERNESEGSSSQSSIDSCGKREIEAILAPCCHPIRGDAVQGMKVGCGSHEAVVVHRLGCGQLNGSCGGELVTVRWAVRRWEVEGDEVGNEAGADEVRRSGRLHPSQRRRTDDATSSEEGGLIHPVRILVMARDCTGLLAYVTGVIASMGSSIQRCSTVTDKDGLMASLAFEVLVRDSFHLAQVVERVEGCEEVDSVRRLDPNEGAEHFGQIGGRYLGVDSDGKSNGNMCMELLREGQSVSIEMLEIEGM